MKRFNFLRIDFESVNAMDLAIAKIEEKGIAHIDLDYQYLYVDFDVSGCNSNDLHEVFKLLED